MQVQVKVPLVILGDKYAPGIHAMPEAYKADWFFLAHVQNGNLVVKGHGTQLKTAKPITPKPAPEQIQFSKGEDAIAAVLEKGMPAASPNKSAQDDEEILETESSDEETSDEEDEEIIEQPKPRIINTAATTNRRGK